MNVGFIGLGIMGVPMAQNLIDVGHHLAICRASPRTTALENAGAAPCASPAEVAERSNIIITMLPDTPDVETALFGNKGVIEGITQGTLLLEMSSISPVGTKRFAERLAKIRCDYVDAPVSGGESGARDATLTIMCGGDQNSFTRALPILESLGNSITHVGPVGAGQMAKVCNQIIVALTIEAVAEALELARLSKLDPAAVRDALLGGFASSTVLQVHGQRILLRDFEPGFKVHLHRKDLRLAEETARHLGIRLPGATLAAGLMQKAIQHGLADLDHSALAMLLHQEQNTGNDPDVNNKTSE